MSDETARIADVLDTVAHDVLAQLQGISPEDLNRPLTLPETNTLFALATHLVGAGEFWALVVAGRRTIPRDRPAEFRATGSLVVLTTRYERWLADVRVVLAAVTPDYMERRMDVNRLRSVPSASSEEVSVREALPRAVKHSALHFGHIQMTRQLLGYAPAAEG